MKIRDTFKGGSVYRGQIAFFTAWLLLGILGPLALRPTFVKLWQYVKRLPNTYEYVWYCCFNVVYFLMKSSVRNTSRTGHSLFLSGFSVGVGGWVIRSAGE